MLNFFSAFLCASVVNPYLPLHFRRIAPEYPLQRHTSDDAADTREPITALSGISWVTTLHFVSIQRHHVSVPPAISAEFVQNL